MRAITWLALALAGCGGGGPLLVWHGRSPDRARRAEVIEAEGRQRVEVDGSPHAEWDAIAVSHLRWTVDGRLVYPAQRDERWHLVVDGAPGPAFLGIGAVATEGGHVAYAAEDDDGWRVVVDGDAGPAFTSIRAPGPVFSPGGRRAAYVARDASGERAVVGGRAGPAFDRVEALGFGAKGALVGYVGVDGGGARVVVDGEVAAIVDDVIGLALAGDEPRWAALAVVDGVGVVLHDGDRIAEAPRASRLTLSEDGARVAWVVVDDEGERVVVDGAPAGAHDAVERLRFVPRTDALVYVARGDDGARVIHDGHAGPRFDAIDGPVVSDAGHFGYVGHRRAGSAVVVDGEAVHRGEWAGSLQLAARNGRWAVVTRQVGQRFVRTPDGRTAVARPFVDTLVLDPTGRHWAIAVAMRDERRLAVVVDGLELAPFDVDELVAAAAQSALGRTPSDVARDIVAGVLAAALR